MAAGFEKRIDALESQTGTAQTSSLVHTIALVRELCDLPDDWEPPQMSQEECAAHVARFQQLLEELRSQN